MEDIIFRYDLHKVLWKNFVYGSNEKESAFSNMLFMYRLNDLWNEDIENDFFDAMNMNYCFACSYAYKLYQSNLDTDKEKDMCYFCPLTNTKIHSYRCCNGLYDQYGRLYAIRVAGDNVEYLRRVGIPEEYKEPFITLRDNTDSLFRGVCNAIAEIPVNPGVLYMDIDGKIREAF